AERCMVEFENEESFFLIRLMVVSWAKCASVLNNSSADEEMTEAEPVEF
ncbi:hypothetical protein CDAR_179991, partial [Caerostris darwini]